MTLNHEQLLKMLTTLREKLSAMTEAPAAGPIPPPNLTNTSPLLANLAWSKEVETSQRRAVMYGLMNGALFRGLVLLLRGEGVPIPLIPQIMENDPTMQKHLKDILQAYADQGWRIVHAGRDKQGDQYALFYPPTDEIVIENPNDDSTSEDQGDPGNPERDRAAARGFLQDGLGRVGDAGNGTQRRGDDSTASGGIVPPV